MYKSIELFYPHVVTCVIFTLSYQTSPAKINQAATGLIYILIRQRDQTSSQKNLPARSHYHHHPRNTRNG